MLLFFVIQLTTANLFAEGLLGLPNLIEHYQEHQKEETPGISFTDFLMLHYLNEQHAASDNEQHEHLPLKNVTWFAMSTVAYSLPEIIVFDLTQKSTSDKSKIKLMPYQDGLVTSCPTGIFQPPRA